MSRFQKGKIGEEIAKNYLIGKGYKFIESNDYSRFGEIDLIFKHGDFTVFVEVKSLEEYSPFYIYETLTKRKKRRVKKSIETWLLKNEGLDSVWRLDFVGILLNEGKGHKIEHFKFVEL